MLSIFLWLLILEFGVPIAAQPQVPFPFFTLHIENFPRSTNLALTQVHNLESTSWTAPSYQMPVFGMLQTLVTENMFK